MMLYGSCGEAGCIDCTPVLIVANAEEYENCGENPLVGVKALLVKEGTAIVYGGGVLNV